MVLIVVAMSGKPDTRIEDAVDKIDAEVDEDVSSGNEQGDPEQRRVIEFEGSLHAISANAWPGENRLGQDCAGQ